MSDSTQAAAVRAVLNMIEDAWRRGRFDGLEACFDERAVIVGPGYKEYAVGARACADSYKEFATSASVMEYSESDHELRLWPSTAIYTFAWRMTYRRELGPSTEVGTDQYVLGSDGDRWRVQFRYVQFSPEAGVARCELSHRLEQDCPRPYR